MSKKHFIELAAAIARIPDARERARTAKRIGTICFACNVNFNWLTWRKACGVEA
jgi:hypothetical protein